MYLLLYQRADNPTYNIIRLGHSYWMLGEIQQAIAFYQEAIDSEGYDYNIWCEQLESDLNLLKDKQIIQSSSFLIKDILYKENH